MAAVSLTSPAKPVSKEADINALDENDCSKLYYAVQKADKAAVELLLSQKATPFVGLCPFAETVNNVPMALLLLGVDPSHPLSQCKDFHEISEKLFPPVTELNVAKMQNLAKKITPPRAFIELQKQLSKLPSRIGVSVTRVMEKIAEKLKLEVPKDSAKGLEFLEKAVLDAPVQLVAEVLAECHPQYQIAWALANKPQPLELITAKDDCMRYEPHNNRIVIGNYKSFQELVESLITGTLFALHRDTTLGLEKNIIGREAYAIAQTLSFSDVEKMRVAMCNCMFKEHSISKLPFFEIWKIANTEKASKIAHLVQNYRKIWDRIFFTHYWGDCLHILREEIEKLAKPKT